MPRHAQRPPPAARAVFLLVALALGSVTEAAAVERTSQGHLTQAQHYMQHGRRDLALTELEAGLSASGGDSHYELHFELARMYHAAGRPARAVPTAKRAVTLARMPSEHREAKALLGSLLRRFSPVLIRSASPDLRELKVLEIDPAPGGGSVVSAEKKKVLDALAQRLRTGPLPLPVTLYLPFGYYVVEDTPIEVRRGERAEVTLRSAARVAAAAKRTAEMDEEQRSTWLLGGLAAGGLLVVSVVLMLLAN